MAAFSPGSQVFQSALNNAGQPSGGGDAGCAEPAFRAVPRAPHPSSGFGIR